MKRVEVQSSNIKSIGYSKPNKSMDIEFSGGVYRYQNVPPAIFESLMASESKGKFVNENVKGYFIYNILPKE
jgi:hypothetical protein